MGIELALKATIGYGMGTILVFGDAEVIYTRERGRKTGGLACQYDFIIK